MNSSCLPAFIKVEEIENNRHFYVGISNTQTIQKVTSNVFRNNLYTIEEYLNSATETKIISNWKINYLTDLDSNNIEYKTRFTLIGLIDNTSFDLPSEFLQKWLATAGEKQLTPEEAAEEYNKSEKGLRYQLIQEKILKENDIKLDYEELKEYAKGFIRTQMAQFGNMNPEDAELDDIANRILGNQEEAKKLQDQLMSQKLMTFYKEKMTFKTKKVTYEGFIKEVYK